MEDLLNSSVQETEKRAIPLFHFIICRIVLLYVRRLISYVIRKT